MTINSLSTSRRAEECRTKDVDLLTDKYSTASSSPSTNRVYVAKQIYWLCGLIVITHPLGSFDFSFSPLVAFEDRSTSLLYAYALSEHPSVLEGPKEFQIGSIRGKDEIDFDDPHPHFLNYQNFLTVGGMSLHFLAKASWRDDYILIIPVEVNLSSEGSAVEFTITSVREYHQRVQYVISEARRVNSILNYQRIDFSWLKEAFLCTVKIVSSILPYPPRLQLQPNMFKQSILSFCEHAGRLYRTDVLCQLGDIITKLFRKVNVNHGHIPPDCIDRIASFLSIEYVVAVTHLDYSDGLFDPRAIKGDILFCFPNILAPLPLEYLFSKNVIKPNSPEDLKTSYRKFTSGELPKNSEEFWILLNESMMSPCTYQKNDIEVDVCLELTFIIPTRQQEEIFENAIRKVRSYLSEKNGLVENKVLKILVVGLLVDDEPYFRASLINVVFKEEGRCCFWYITSDDGGISNSVIATLPFDWMKEFEVLFHMQERICSTGGQVIMLTDDFRSEQSVKEGEPHCTIGRSDEERDFAIIRHSDLIISLGDSIDDFWMSIAAERDVPSVPLPQLWKIITDTFGISNYSIIGSQEDAPCQVPSDLLVLTNSRERRNSDLNFSLGAASVKCIRNNKLAIASQYMNEKDDQNRNTAPPDDEAVHDLRIFVLTWFTSTGTWKICAERATASISASGKVLDWKCLLSDKYFESRYDSSSEDLNDFFISLKFGRLQVEFLTNQPEVPTF